MDHDGTICPGRAGRLSDPRRLTTQLPEEQLVRLLALQGTEDILDLGCGTGFYTDRIAVLTTGTVYALELHPAMLEAYRERGVPGNVSLVLGDIADPPLAAQSVDVAVSIATYHETAGDLGLPKLIDILRPTGRVVVVDWRKEPTSGQGGPPAAIRFSKEEVAVNLAPYFSSISTEDLGPNMFAVVAERGTDGAE